MLPKRFSYELIVSWLLPFGDNSKHPQYILAVDIASKIELLFTIYHINWCFIYFGITMKKIVLILRYYSTCLNISSRFLSPQCFMYCLFLWFYFYFRDLFFIACWSSSESQTVCLWSNPSWSSRPLWFCNRGNKEKALWYSDYWKWQWSLCRLGCQSQSRFEMTITVLYFLLYHLLSVTKIELPGLFGLE